jgi:tape measure domain-containing protein
VLFGEIASAFVRVESKEDPRFKSRIVRSAESAGQQAGQRGGGRFASFFTKFGTAAVLGVAGAAAAGLGALGFMGLRTASNLQQAQISFETLLGSGKEARVFMGELAEFAARTPFELPGLQDAARQMLGTGRAAEDVIPALTAWGDASGALGLTQEQFSRAQLAANQAMSKGKLQAEEMMQITEAGIPVWQLLSRALDKPIPKLQEMASEGKLIAEDVLPKLEEQMRKDYGGSMAKQSQTLSGLWSTLMDTINMGSADVLQPLVGLLGDKMPSAIEAVAGWFESLSGWITEDLVPALGTLKEPWDFMTAALRGEGAGDLSFWESIGDLITDTLIPALVELMEFVGEVANTFDDDVSDMSDAAREHLGVKVPDATVLSWKAVAEMERRNKVKLDDGVEGFKDFYRLIHDDTLTFGEKFGIAWRDIWAANNRREERNIALFIETLRGGLYLGTIRLLGELFDSWHKSWSNFFKLVGTNLRVQLFVLRLMWSNWTDDVMETLRGWGRRVSSFFGGIPDNIIDALGDVGKRIKDAFMDALGGGLSIPIKLLFGGDGLGLGGVPGVGGGGLMGVPEAAAVAQLYRSIGSPGDVISGSRPGATTLSGAASYHSMNRALDFSPMRSVAQLLFGAFRSRITELISPWPELGVWHGRPHRYSDSVQAQHDGRTNVRHIHLALAKGGFFRRPTWMDSGQLAEREPEVVSPVRILEETFQRVLERAGGRSGRTINLAVHTLDQPARIASAVRDEMAVYDLLDGVQ